MEAAQTERRLSAILATDIVGYSRLFKRDEAGTLAAIRKLRSEVIDPLLAQHHGRVVKLVGDGAIFEFGSVVDAVACAIAVQKQTASARIGEPPERRIIFRVGVNLGDVVVDGTDLLGDGVREPIYWHKRTIRGIIPWDWIATHRAWRPSNCVGMYITRSEGGSASSWRIAEMRQ